MKWTDVVLAIAAIISVIIQIIKLFYDHKN